jgi:pimeloyl-ACP methyl ester carboxylesterase
VSAFTLVTADGVRLAARWHRPRPTGSAPGPGAGPTGDVDGSGDGIDGGDGMDGGDGPRDGVAVVVVHGFCGSQHEPAVGLVALAQAAAGRAVLTFDLRGHGASGGATTLGLLERLDVDSAVRAARSDADIVVVVGESLGGVASIEHLAAGYGGGRTGDGSGAVADGGVVVGTPARWQVPRSPRGIAALVLTRTPPGRVVAARRMGTRVAVRPRRGPEPRIRVTAVRRPLAVIHGLADRFVSPAAAHTLHAAAAEPRLLDLVPGMGHGFCVEAVDPVGGAVDWVVRHAAQRAAQPALITTVEPLPPVEPGEPVPPGEPVTAVKPVPPVEAVGLVDPVTPVESGAPQEETA